MSALPGGMDRVVIRLSPGVIFTVDGDGRPRAEICRGEAVTRYAIDPHIQTFLECFRQPLTLQEAARVLAPEGFDPANVVQFGTALLKTPLLELQDDTVPVPSAADILGAAGLTLVTAFKDRKFDGVYQVCDRDGGGWIVKLLRGPPSLGVSQRVLRRLENEYAVLKRLSDVAGVAGVRNFVAAPHPYFEMELVAGASLGERIMRRATLAQRIAMAHAAADTVAQVHAHGVIHGDLHTGNFLVDAENRLRLIDFDCSFVRGTDYVPRVGGAVHFMPPERMSDEWHGNRNIVPDFVSDIYQLGIILYFVLSGAPPFRGKQYAGLTAAIRAGTYAPLRTTREGEPVPAALAQAVEACMAFAPAQRPATLDHLRAVFLSLAVEQATQ